MAQSTATQSAPEAANEAEQVRRALTRDAAAFRVIMQSHNRRLYRIARSILRNNADAEDAVQEAYVSAFTKLASYRGEATLASWLCRIVINEFAGTYAAETFNHRSCLTRAAARRCTDYSISSINTER